MRYLAIILLVLISTTTFLSCRNKFYEEPALNILLFKDKVGIYTYNPNTKEEKEIFKATRDEIFLHEPIEVSDNTIVFAIKGELKLDKTNFNHEQYTKKYYTLNLSNQKHFLSKTIDYYIDRPVMRIQTTYFNDSGIILSTLDSITNWRGGSYTNTSVSYNHEAERYFSKSAEVEDQFAFSKRGNIYYVKKLDTTLLVKYTGKFDPKFGSGFYQPQISHSADYLLYRYLPPMKLINFSENAALYKFDLKTKERNLFKKGVFVNFAISKDDKFLLFTRNERQVRADTYNSDVYVLELSSKNEKYIGRASFACWME